jgi:D-arabinose 1-dehydrogenase-like Zn-dependent alcohol dehydrogenase
VEEVEVAPPGRLEVRVRVLFTSICHTDLSAWKGEVRMHYSHHIQYSCVLICMCIKTIES